ncbi:Eukaryotic initiation factor 3, gamma subunit domain-containing protein [Rozella allomycis CSF55]|uniref:tRNA (adenine(58)-N(1))-methyltransferase non-catalytic subunit TRM6 n=1 Tax=Rozella allomycis (strain CSF55) TaxID=988480 RepID=A0A075B1T5_ROZAC|nr:Eukaryotic initiation factor 3, gamma subunit domain-containing protein [Rozella allomycis CSF55]|eukprot:EPZ34931.1 Eukaryotic initiation factor 3, gamma subunit domain-containing protein [Rozella allomycis CSF55]
MKLVQITSKNISLGKYGSFNGSKLVGKPYGTSFEIINNENLVPFVKEKFEDLSEDIKTTKEAPNSELNDDNTAQNLSYDDILELKKEGLKGNKRGRDIVNEITESSDSFSKRTTFAKAKYIEKKKRKFMRVFTVLQTTAKNLCEFYFSSSSYKIGDLRIDSLSQILNFANIHAGLRVLIVDDFHGLLAGAVLERMNGQGSIFVVGDHPSSTLDKLPQFNFDKDCMNNSISYLSWNNVDSLEDRVFSRSIDLTSATEEQVQKFEMSKAKFDATTQKVKNNRENLMKGDFDALIVFSKHEPQSIINRLSKYIYPSRPLVAFSTCREVLSSSYVSLRQSKQFVNVQLTESWIRNYQVLPGRMHPTMTTSASGGFILSAIKVLDIQ